MELVVEPINETTVKLVANFSKLHFEEFKP